MAQHINCLEKFEADVDQLGGDVRNWPKEARGSALSMIIKSADLANNTRPVPFAVEWAARLYEGNCN